MSISDVFALFIIVFAIAALISERSRTYVLLKFNKAEWFWIGFLFLFINYLLAFDWLCQRLPIIGFWDADYFPQSNIWAYIVTILLLVFVFYKIFFGFYPSSRQKDVIDNYTNLLLKGEAAFLIDLIEKYHLADIIQFLRKVRSIKISNESGIWVLDNPKYIIEFNKVINTKRLRFAQEVYNQIILNDTFLDFVASTNPIFFAPLIQELKIKKIAQPEYVNRLLKILTRNKNGFFFREIKNTKYLTGDDTYIIEEENKILYSLFSDIKVAEVNEAWRGVADEAILEMADEAKEPYSPLRLENNERDDDTRWNYRMQYAIQYFDIMVRQAIFSNIKDHMWLLYYRNFTRAIIDNMNIDPGINRNSRNFQMLENIISNMVSWKDIVIATNKGSLIYQIIYCISDCLYSIAITAKLNKGDKRYLMNWVWEDLITHSYPPQGGENDLTKVIWDESIKAFRNPKGSCISIHDSLEDKEYIKAINNLWENRDIPVLHGRSGERANRFKDEVLDKLG